MQNPIILDFKISNIKNIEELHFSFDENIGTRVKNIIELANTNLNLKLELLKKIFQLKNLRNYLIKSLLKDKNF